MRTHRLRLTCAVVLIAGCQSGASRLGCGPANPETNPSKESAPGQSVAGDLDPMPIHEIATPDGQVQLDVEAPEAPVMRNKDIGEGDRELLIQLPGNAEIYCIVYAERKDAGNGLIGALRGFDSDGPPTGLAIEDLGVDVAEGRPLLWARARVETNGDSGGAIHAAVGVSQFETFACRSQRLPGTQTFLRIYRGMLQSLRSPDTGKPVDLTYESTTTLRSPDGNLVGFIDEHIHDRPDGTTWLERYSSHVTMSPESRLSASDERFVETATEDNVVQGFYVRRDDGADAYTLRMKITGTAPRKYTARGELDGEPFEAEFLRQQGLPDVHARAAELQRIVREAPRKPIPFVEYDPSTNPKEPTTILIRLEEGDGPHNAAIIAGAGRELQATIRESGQIVAGQTLLDGAVVDMRLEWSEGSPLLVGAPPTPTGSPEDRASEGPSEAPPAE